MKTAEAITLSSGFDPALHNGEITLTSPRTGEHRTFRIKTKVKGDLKGKRVLSLLMGPQNTSDYQPFAFVAEDGRVHVWKKFRSSEDGDRNLWEKYADLIERSAYWEARGVEFLVSGHCRRCNRLLTTPESVKTGIGPVCDGRE